MRRGLAQRSIDAGRWSDAEQILQSLLASDPNDTEARFLKGTMLYRQGYFRAAEPFLRGVTSGPIEREARAMRAVSLMKSDQVEEGEPEARRLLAERPPLNDIDLTLTLAEVLYERGDLTAALALVDEAAAFAPRHPIPPYWRARVQLQQKKIAEATKSAEDSVRLAPQLPFAHDLLSRLYRLQGRSAEAAREAEWLRQFENQKTQGARK